ncbi:MAG: replicative DNA helicase [Saccharofermentans sp.]|nr:replicative DNA helicase [Saccharofermentans sp.]
MERDLENNLVGDQMIPPEMPVDNIPEPPVPGISSMPSSFDEDTVDLTDNSGEKAIKDLETEKALLALCIGKKEGLDKVVLNRIVKEDFADPRHSLIFETISELYVENGKIDRFNICNALESKGKLMAAGGNAYVFSVANTDGVMSNIDSYISIIREKSRMRSFVNTLSDLTKKAMSGRNSVNDLVDSGVGKFTEMRENDEGTGFEQLNSILRHNIEEIHNLSQNTGGIKAIKSGFRGLDNMLGGFRPGTLNIVAARPGMGKTALVINIAVNVASHRHYPVNIFSLEMSKSEIGNRILASRSNVSGKQLQRAKVSPDEEKELWKSVKELSDLPIFVDDTSTVTPGSMRSKCKELKNKGDLGLVIVDYLQLMSYGERANSSRQQEVSDISRSLKVLAKELEVPIIALSQLSRGTEKRGEDHTPMLSDLRDSGAIEQDADSVLFIDRPDYYKKDAEDIKPIQDAKLIVAKNRHGETGSAPVKWWGAKTLFFEEDRRYDPQDPQATGTQSKMSSSANYSYEAPDDGSNTPPPEQPPFDMREDDIPPENPDNESFFEDSNSDFPEGF